MNLFELFIPIHLKDEEVEKGISKLKGGLGIVAGVGAAAVGAAATGLVAIGKASVAAYGEYEQLAGGAKLLFGDAYDYIEERSKDAWKNVQMSQNDYLQQANGFATGLKTALNGDSQAAAELADKIMTAEADIIAATGNSQEMVQNAFNGIMKNNFTMLDNLQLGINPTKEGMQDLIDQVNAWNAANGEATSYQLGNLADMQAALVDYVEMQGLAGYAANEAAETLQGSFAATKSAWDNLVSGFSNPDADVGALIDNLADSASTAFDNLLPIVGRAIEGIGNFITQAAPVLIEKIPGLIEQMIPAVLAGAASIVVSLVQALPNIALALVNAVMTIADQIGQLIAEKAPGLAEIAQNIVEYFQHAWENVQKIWDVVKPYFELLWHDIQRVFSVVEAVLGGFFKTAWEAIKLVWDAATGYFQTIFDTVTGIFEVIDAVLSGDFSRAWEAIKGVFASWRDFFSGLWDDLLNVFSTIKEAFLNIGRNLVEGLLGGIQERWNKLTGWIGQGIQNLKNMFTGKQGFDEHSPSKWAEGVFSNVAEGGISGWDKTFPELASDLSGDIAGLRSSFALGSLSMQPALAGGVNTMPSMAAFSSVAGTAAQPRSPIVIQVQLDKKTIAQATYNEFQDEQTRRGASLINP